MDVDNNVEAVDNNVEAVDNVQTGAQRAEAVDYEKLYQMAAQSVTELTAERDSLLSENAELRSARDAALAESAKTKEVNYTLSRQLNIGTQQQREPEQILADMFLKGKGNEQ